MTVRLYIVITDNSIEGWSLDITSTNGGTLNNQTPNGGTMVYTLTMETTAGLGLGLTLAPVAGTALTLNPTVTVSTTGPATTASAYSFTLNMDIAGDATGTLGKLAGDYEDTISFLLSSND